MIITDLFKYSRLAWDLRSFLQNNVTLELSKQVITERLVNREQNLLTVIQRGIFQSPKSPYLKMLEIAGCEFGDIEAMVGNDGVEGALQKLYDSGVYLSTDEYKGRIEITRGGTSFPLEQSDLDNPFTSHWYRGQSSGTRSAGTRTTFDLRHRFEQSYYWLPALAAVGAIEFPLAIWLPIPPAMSGIGNVLQFHVVGKPAARWFSPVEERTINASLTHRMALGYMIYGSRLWGARLAKPEFVSLQNAGIVARWMADAKKEYGGCSLHSPVSLGCMVCDAALAEGLDIGGTRFTCGGEPLTEAKRRRVEATGASIFSRYTASEIGRIGSGCAFSDGDDMHFFSDSMGVIQRRRKVAHSDVEVDSFLFTPILPTAPKVLLNYEIGDYGVIETRKCDCIFGELGFDRHLHGIRSFDKLTGAGVTVSLGFVRVLEEVLPRKYGGAPTDYQLIEEEDAEGQTRLNLIVSPAVGEVDEKDIINTILDELRKSDRGGGLTASLWSQAETIRVKRMYPISRSGKIVTLELKKGS